MLCWKHRRTHSIGQSFGGLVVKLLGWCCVVLLISCANNPPQKLAQDDFLHDEKQAVTTVPSLAMRHNALCEALQNSSLADQALTSLISTETPLNKPCADGLLPLLHALNNNGPVDELMDLGADINAALNQGGLTVLTHAIANHDLALMEKAIAVGADLTTPTREGLSPLIVSFLQIDPAPRQYLESLGLSAHDWSQQTKDNVQCRVANSEQLTQVHGQHLIDLGFEQNIACERYIVSDIFNVLHNTEQLEVFLKQSNDVNTLNQAGETPLVVALLNNLREAVYLLLEHGASAEMLRAHHLQVLYHQPDVDLLKQLYQAGLPQSEVQKLTDDMLCLALLDRSADEVDVALTRGASPNAVCALEGGGSEPALFFTLDYPELLSLFLSHQADLNIRNTSNETPLQVTLKKRNVAAVEQLLAAGASAASLTLDHVTLFYYEGHYLKLIDQFLSSGIEQSVHEQGVATAVCYALRSQDNIENYFHDSKKLKGFSLSNCQSRLEDGRLRTEPALFKAIRAQLDVVAFLEDGVTANLKANDESALSVALESHNLAAVAQLLAAGASAKDLTTERVKFLYAGHHPDLINQLKLAGLSDQVNEAAMSEHLCDALSRKSHAYVQLESVLTLGANANTLCHSSTGYNTPAIFLALSINQGVDLLLNAGASPNVRNPAELTPLMVALNKQDVEAVNVLLQAKANAESVRYNQVKFLYDADDATTLSALKTAGMNVAFDEYATILSHYENECARYPFQGGRNFDYVRAYEAPISQYASESSILGVLFEKYRECLESVFYTAKNYAAYPVDKQSNAQVRIDETILHPAFIKATLASSYLTSAIKQDQHHQRAIDLFNESYFEIDSAIDQAQFVLRTNGIFMNAMSKQVIPPLVNRNQVWNKEGLRMHVARFGNAFPVLHDRSGLFDHTRYLVRIVTDKGDCNGAVIGPGTVLTAQRCVIKQGEAVRELAVVWDYIGVNNSGLYVQADRTQAGWDVQTSLDRHEDSWKNDWAILRLDVEPSALPYWLRSGLELATNAEFNAFAQQYKETSIAMAGYFNDVDGRYLTMNWGCDVAFRPGSLIAQHCQRSKRDTGSVYVIANGAAKGKVVGVHAFSFNEKVPGTPSGQYNGGGASVKEVLSQIDAGNVREFFVLGQ